MAFNMSIIAVENLSKRYTIQHRLNRNEGLRHVLEEKLTAPFRALFGRSRSKDGSVMQKPEIRKQNAASEDFWALKNVSFEIRRGEVVGIIGRNGAGKSTLLKILSRITEPTEGRVRLRGRVASLLEVGTGFHGELTGRENIFLNGAILGMSKVEIRRKFNEIVAFSEVEKFLDTPVKRYSSGMYVRLAFAVAAHLEPEILIVDEVLAVGDAEFQKKCLGKMQDVAAKEGRTVLFVSHNMAAINRLCQRAILLEKGAVAVEGKTATVVEKYLQTGAGNKVQFIPDPAVRVGNDAVALLALAVRGPDNDMGPSFVSSAALKVEIIYHVSKPVRGLRVGFNLYCADGTLVFNSADAVGNEDDHDERSYLPGVYASVCAIPAGFLNRGQYSIAVGSDVPGGTNFYCENVVFFSIEAGGGRNTREDNRPGLICPHFKWEILRKEEFGITEKEEPHSSASTYCP